MNNVRVQILYSKNYGDKIFQDALYFTPEEYAQLTEEDLESIKQERFNNWITAINKKPELIEEIFEEVITEE